MSRKLAVFDFDGTLVESQVALDQAIIEFSVAHNMPYDVKKMAVGYVDPLKYDLGWGIPLERQPDLFAELVDFHTNELIKNRRFMPVLFDDVMETLDVLKPDYDLAIVTVRDRETLEVILDERGLKKYFSVYRTRTCAKERNYGVKPAPDALHCILKETKHDILDVVVIGDTTSDIGMANAAGAKSIAALWGIHSREKLAEHNPTLMLNSIKELPKGLKTIFSPG